MYVGEHSFIDIKVQAKVTLQSKKYPLLNRVNLYNESVVIKAQRTIFLVQVQVNSTLQRMKPYHQYYGTFRSHAQLIIFKPANPRLFQRSCVI